MSIDNIVVGFVVTTFAVFMVALFSVSLYANAAPRKLGGRKSKSQASGSLILSTAPQKVLAH